MFYNLEPHKDRIMHILAKRIKSVTA